MINVTNEVSTNDYPEKTAIRVYSHLHYDNLIIIEIGEEERIVDANDLKAAIVNATNTSKYH